MKGRLFPFFTLGVRRTGVVTREDLFQDPSPPAHTGPPILLVERCDLQGQCVLACPASALCMEEGDLVLDIGRCISCRACLDACPNTALVPAPTGEVANADRARLEVRYHVR